MNVFYNPRLDLFGVGKWTGYCFFVETDDGEWMAIINDEWDYLGEL